MQKLAEPAIDAVRTGDTTFIPDRFKKIYFNWMENIKDWCISRQLWWGHRIPAYYCDECGEVVVSKSKPDSCPKCGHISFHQDEDVLDTWFSSALWPLSTLGWPEKTPDFEKFYPNDVLVTGFDIIFFWVARMIFSGLKYDGRTPFHHVYIHGIIRDSLGRKMSKSLGNGIDPLEVVNQYGADALRFALVTGNAAGNDSRWQPEKIESSRNFANKINNAARFIIMNLEDFEYSDEFDLTELSNIDKWIISRTNEMINEVTINLDKYELGIALEKLYNFIWTEFCDWYIEFSKSKLNGEDGKARYAAQWTLYTVFIDILKLLHPFMPFITEYIYMHICEGTSPLIISKWPVYSESKDFKNEQFEVSEIIEGIRGLRNARVKLNIAPSKKSDLIIVPKNGNEAIYRGNEDIFVKMAGAENVTIMDTYNDIDNVITIITNSAKFFMPLNNLIDKEKELQRLNHEIEKISKDIEMIKTKLSNENFVNKAPEKVVAGEREKLRKAEEKLDETISEISKYQ